MIVESLFNYNVDMNPTPDSTAFDRGISPFLQIFLPEKARQVVDYRADSDVRDRIEQLARKSTEGDLSEEERKEYEGYVRANKFIALLQRKAREVLGKNSDCE